MMPARRASLLLLIAYPCSVHYGVVSNDYRPAVIVIAAAAAWLAGQRAHGFRWLPALAAVLAVSAAALAVTDHFELMILPPLLIYFGLAAVFALTLLPGRQALVTRIATLLDGEPDAAVRRYTRRVTAAWAVFLLLLGGCSVWLACCGTREAWSLFTNLYGYLLILGFFLGEFLLRRRCLPQVPRRSFAGFLAAMARLDRRSLR